MSNKQAIVGGIVYTPNEIINDGLVLVDGGIIQYVGQVNGVDYDDYDHIDAKGLYVAPGLIDLQVNGGGGYLYTTATSHEQLEAISNAHARTGTTTILPTVISDTIERMQAAINLINDAYNRQNKQGAQIAGVHLEGPYLNEARRGGHAAEYLTTPTVSHFNRLMADADGLAKIVSLSPELPGATELISYLARKNIRVSLAHTKATQEDVSNAARSGLSMATHLYNAMDGLGSREPGTVGAVLSNDAISFGLICDGKHVHPMSLKVAIRAAGVNRVFAVTDAVSPLGTTATNFKLYGVDVVVRNGGCYTPEGTLAGSATPLITGLKNLVQLAGLSLQDALQITTINPANQIGIANTRGSLTVGKRGDLIIFDNEFSIRGVVINGSPLKSLTPVSL